MYEGILSWLNLIKYIWEIVRSIARDEESVKNLEEKLINFETPYLVSLSKHSIYEDVRRRF